jgi:hypothetical protein
MALLRFNEIWKLQKEINKVSWDNDKINMKILKNEIFHLYTLISKLYECVDPFTDIINNKDDAKINSFKCFNSAMSINVLDDSELRKGTQARFNRLWDNYSKRLKNNSKDNLRKGYDTILNIVSLNGYMLSFFRSFEDFDDDKIYYEFIITLDDIINDLIKLFVILEFEKKDILNMYKKEYNRICG